MARRRPTAAPVEELPDGPDLVARIAWSYLTALLAGLAAALLVVIGSAVLPAVCAGRADVGSCVFGGTLALGLLGWILAALPLGLAFRLGWLFWCAVVACAVGLVVAGAIDQWWWWVAVVLSPAAAAVASARYRPAGRPGWQRWGLIGAAVIAVAVGGWWLLVGP